MEWNVFRMSTSQIGIYVTWAIWRTNTIPGGPGWQVHRDTRSEPETNKEPPRVWDFIPSPEDNTLERYLGFNVQFFAFAVPLARLCLNKCPRPSGQGVGKWRNSTKKGEVMIPWKRRPSEAWLCWQAEAVAMPSRRRSSLGTRRALPKLQGIGLEFAKTAVGRDDVVVKRSQWITCYQKQSFRISMCLELRRKSLEHNQIVK